MWGFFSNITGFSAFFSKSTKRTNVLNEIVGRKIPTNAPIRWNFSSRVVYTIEKYRKNTIDVFEYMAESEQFKNDQVTLREAFALTSLLCDENLIFFLKMFKMIFEQTEIVFQILQTKYSDVNYCEQRINSLKNLLNDFRNSDHQFNNLFEVLCSNFDESFLNQKGEKLLLVLTIRSFTTSKSTLKFWIQLKIK